MRHSADDYIRVIREEPVRIAHLAGFPLLGPLHNEWMKEMLYGQGDYTLLAHRLSYKTTTVSVVLAILLGFSPRSTILFLRKTDTDVQEIIEQVRKILLNPDFAYIVGQVMGRDLQLTKSTSTEISTNLNDSPRGTGQLLGMGIGGSLTGKHYDRIFTDDIVNLEDRRSKAERERTKAVYQELENVKNHNGRKINTGTPWHREDAISVLMTNVHKYDCYHTGIMSDEMIEEKRRSMAPSLFAANYELVHIAAENALFKTPPVFITLTEAKATLKRDDAMPEDLLRDGIAHIDAAYGGEDYTAFTCGQIRNGKLYLFGKLWHKHVDTVLDYCCAQAKELMCGPIMTEKNADKGYLAQEILSRGASARPYTEKENKYVKISTYLRKWWPNIHFLTGTDNEYIQQIMDYTEDAEHDDGPDSCACVCRYFDRRGQEEDYHSPFATSSGGERSLYAR